MRNTRPNVEQPIRMVGQPLGIADVQVFKGSISSLLTVDGESTYMLFNMTACGGNSGSSVVERGR